MTIIQAIYFWYDLDATAPKDIQVISTYLWIKLWDSRLSLVIRKCILKANMYMTWVLWRKWYEVGYDSINELNNQRMSN